MTLARQCDHCPQSFRWLLDLYRHLVADHGLESHQLPAPRPLR